MIPQLEFGLRMKFIQKDISSLNATGFAEHFTKFIETTVYCSKNIRHIKSTFDVVAPTRENIPTLDSYISDEPLVEQVARDAVLGYGIHTVMVGQFTSILELKTALVGYFGNSFPGKSVFEYWNNGLLSLTGLDQVVAAIVKSFFETAILHRTIFVWPVSGSSNGSISLGSEIPSCHFLQFGRGRAGPEF